MAKLNLWVPVAAALFLGAVGVSADDYDPFNISQDAFRKRIRTLALVPAQVPRPVPNDESVRTEMETRLTVQLRAAGFEVVPSREYARIWREMSERLGGTYDEKDGSRIEERWKIARAYTLRALGADFRADGVASLYFHHGPLRPVRDGPFFAAPERLQWEGKPVHRQPQKVLGYFLDFTIHDLSDARIFGIAIPFQWTEIRMNSGREVVPPEALFADSDEIAIRIARALEALAPPAPP